jgi:RNA polymerase sigma-70 factor (ECF subfamily)
LKKVFLRRVETDLKSASINPMPADRPSSPSPPTESIAAQRDADIVRLLQDGAMQLAFEALMQRYESKVFHLCLAMLRDTPTAQDIAQDSLLRAWRSLASYKPGLAALSTWIYAITRNRCLTELARRQQVGAHRDDSALWDDIEQLPALVPPQDPAALQLLRRLVDALPAPYQACLKLYYFEEHSVDEVADMLGLPQGTVKTHLSRGRQALHKALAAQGLASASLWL